MGNAMNSKHWHTLELAKILKRLAGYTQFSGGARLAMDLTPCGEIHETQDRLAVTSEARRLLDARPDTTIGGARDVRDKVAIAQRGATLTPSDLLESTPAGADPSGTPFPTDGRHRRADNPG